MRINTHIVRAGESVSSVARDTNTSIAEIILMNGLPRGESASLPVGTELVSGILLTPQDASHAVKAARDAVSTSSPEAPGHPVIGCKANLEALYAKHERDATGTDKWSAGVLKTSAVIQYGLLGLSHNATWMAAEANFRGGASAGGWGAKGEAKAALKSQQASLFAGSDANNPWFEAGGKYDIALAEAKSDMLLGSDGHRTGWVEEVKVKATAVKGEIFGEINIPLPFDNTLSLRGKAKASAGSAGVHAGIWAYKDEDSGRHHFGVAGEVAALLGLGGDFDMSVGPKFQSRTRPRP